MSEKQLYKISEAAEILNVSRQTIYDWLKSGKLWKVEFSGYPFIPAAAIEAARNGNKKKD